MRVLDLSHAAVGLSMVELDRARAFEHHRLRDFHLQVFAAFRQTDGDVIFLVRVGQDQRALDGFERARNHDPGPALFLVEFEFDRHELWIVCGADGGSEEFKPGIARLSAENREQGGALIGGRALVDESLQEAVALV